ncbi:glycosyltransferase family 4 protein [Alkalihalophilus sp. As8PL]|uniref:Glycosyltransferase family 4 protein n=1 Tax=Alkalihalophilus sp. As8PL TaxID=3237103 RepID=A0AB39BP25_9BACI
MLNYIIGFVVALVTTILAVPLVRIFAKKYGFIDQPNQRKIHAESMPRLGGVAIAIGTMCGLLYLLPSMDYIAGVGIGAFILIITGIIDDKYIITARWKLLAQIAAAIAVVLSGIKIDHVVLPFNVEINFGFLGYLVTIIWIVAIVNSINFIDGLDGLAGGVSTIAITTMLILALLSPGTHAFIIATSIVLIGSLVGFLFFNFHPANIFMGDTGSLFIGYCIAVISILGFFKSVTFVSLLFPIIILGVPILDTSFAIIRRALNNQKISAPDKGHLHHCLLQMGYGHRKTVFIIYGISALFSASALTLTVAPVWTAFIILLVLTITTQIFAEFVGLIGETRKPILSLVRKISVFGQAMKNR